MQYTTQVVLDDLRVEDIEAVMELGRAVGYPRYSHRPGKPAILTLDFEIGGEGEIADLWDLREICEEIEAQLCSYVSLPHVPKPWTALSVAGVDNV